MAPVSDEMRSHVEDGIRLCRSGDWNKGLPVLAAAIENRGVAEQVPGIAYSYLGFGVARFQGKHREGLRLCEHAIKIQYYEADNHWNLARVHVLAANRKQAVQALERALKLDPDHEGLLALKNEIGLRQPTVLKWLGREHPVNRLLGRLRHNMKSNEPASSKPDVTGTRIAAPPGVRTGTRTPAPPGVRTGATGATGATGSRTPRPPGVGSAQATGTRNPRPPGEGPPVNRTDQ